MKILYLLSSLPIFLLFENIAFAYDLNGNISNESGNNYSIVLQNNNGHEYSGDATDSGDGTLEVNVEDYNGQSYSGTATPNGNGEYNLDLQNNSSGGNADGIATLDN